MACAAVPYGACPLTKMNKPLDAIQSTANQCITCNRCVKECAFLKEYGNPGTISEQFLSKTLTDPAIVFQCNLCNLCQAVCPLELGCSEAFLEIRRVIISEPQKKLPEHKTLCAYENRGRSKLFSTHLFPENCSTIFFPGCTLAGTRAKITDSTYQFLKTIIPDLGIVLDCCTKPSHDIGRDQYFHESFSKLITTFKQHGIIRIITACPSCHDTFKTYAPELKIITAYQLLADNPPPITGFYPGTVSIHDACATRFSPEIHSAVRSLARERVKKIEEVKHCRSKAICCGEGGAAAFVAPQITSKWQELRKEETDGKRVITYCAGCSSTLGKTVPTTHLLDLIFDTKKAIAQREQSTKTPFTYLNRLALKQRLKKTTSAAREENIPDVPHDKKHSFAPRLLLILALLLATVGTRTTGIDSYFDFPHLDKLISLCQNCPPSLYIAVLAIVPVVFLPAFPVVIAGGLLYGHTWGIIYALIGATLGCSASFLISRYIARFWLESLFNNQKWEKLQDMTELHGWKIVILLRLIPLFPFTPLNYALGLTGIKFSHYVLASFVGILPACVAFILFSRSFWDLLNGELTINLIVGSFLLFFVLLTPLIYKRYKTIQ